MLTLSIDADLKVRDAEPADVPAMAAVHVETWRDAFPGILDGRQLRSVDRRSSANMFERMIHSRRRGRRVLVLTDADGTIVGLSSGGPHRGRLPFRGEIYQLYVHPDHQGRGGGRLLWSRMSWALADLGLLPVMLWTPEKGHAKRFYQSCGGQLVGKGRDGNTPLLAYGWPDALPLPVG